MRETEAAVIYRALTPWVDGHAAFALRRPEDVAGVVVHRIEVSQEDTQFTDTPRDVARFFREHPIGRKATGGGMPYPLLVAASGMVTQTLPLGRITPHAVSHNPTTVGVACIGDFRTCTPPPEQVEALAAVCAAVLRDISKTADAIFAHDELAGGSRDPEKECPGRLLPIREVRRRIATLIGEGVSLPQLVW